MNLDYVRRGETDFNQYPASTKCSFLYYQYHYSETCILRPPLGPRKGGLYLQVVFISRSNLHMIRTVCSEKGGLRSQVVFLDSGHIIQVSLY